MRLISHPRFLVLTKWLTKFRPRSQVRVVVAPLRALCWMIWSNKIGAILVNTGLALKKSSKNVMKSTLSILLIGSEASKRLCEPLNEWNCPVETTIGSVCTRDCSYNQIKFEKMRCVCHQASCVWIRRGKSCAEKEDQYRRKHPKQQHTIQHRHNHQTVSSQEFPKFSRSFSHEKPPANVDENLLKKLFSEIANFNLYDSVINFYF